MIMWQSFFSMFFARAWSQVLRSCNVRCPNMRLWMSKYRAGIYTVGFHDFGSSRITVNRCFMLSNIYHASLSLQNSAWLLVFKIGSLWFATRILRMTLLEAVFLLIVQISGSLIWLIWQSLCVCNAQSVPGYHDWTSEWVFLNEHLQGAPRNSFCRNNTCNARVKELGCSYHAARKLKKWRRHANND